MVFVIQNTQNRDGAAIRAKLDELIRVTQTYSTPYRAQRRLASDILVGRTASSSILRGPKLGSPNGEAVVAV
jgi:Low affinity iron permease